MGLKDVVNDIMVSVSNNNEFTQDGFKKLSNSVFFNKYFVVITSVSLILIGLTGFLRIEFSINTLIFQFISYSVFACILFIYYLKVGRFYKTLYIKEESLLVLDGYSHKIESISGHL